MTVKPMADRVLVLPEAAEEKEPAETEKTEEPGESETQEPVESQKPAAVIEDKREAANKIVLSGVNGTVAYEMDDKGTLTIKGSGEIPKHLLDNMAYEHEVKSIAFSGNQLTGLADECFYNFAKLKSIKIPGNITSIGMYAFRYCEELQTVELANGVVNIGAYAFDGCEKLKSITFGANFSTAGAQIPEYPLHLIPGSLHAAHCHSEMIAHLSVTSSIAASCHTGLLPSSTFMLMAITCCPQTRPDMQASPSRRPLARCIFILTDSGRGMRRS